MKCPLARTWLLLAESVEDLPRPVTRHLDDCARCRKRQQRLNTLHDLTASAPIPSLPDDMRSRLFAELNKLPGPVAPSQTLSVPSAKPARFPYMQVAALVLSSFAFGWLATGLQSSKNDQKNPTSETSGEDLLATHLIELNRRLVGSTSPNENTVILLDMAGELSGRTLSVAREGSIADIALYTDLHRRVIRQGVLPQLRATPVDQRAALVKKATEHCLTVISEIDDISDHHEKRELVGPALAQLNATVQKAKELIQSSKPWPPEQNAQLADSTGPWRTLLTVLVMQGLRLAEERDPLRREGYGNELVELEQTIQRVSRSLNALEQARRTTLRTPGTAQPLSASEQERVGELQRSLDQIGSELRRLQMPPGRNFSPAVTSPKAMNKDAIKDAKGKVNPKP